MILPKHIEKGAKLPFDELKSTYKFYEDLYSFEEFIERVREKGAEIIYPDEAPCV